MAEPTDGYINLHRAIREHPYWSDPDRLRAWIDILLMAAWKPHRRMIGTSQESVGRGELVASERFLADRWGWSRGKVRRWIAGAVENGELRRVREVSAGRYQNRPTNEPTDGTVYLVVKYDTYQTRGPANGTSSGTDSGPTAVPTADQIEEREEGEEEKKASPKKRAHSLPDEWTPNEQHQAIATEEGRSLIREIEAFRDHALANGRRQLDWDAAFRNWLRSDIGKPTRPAPREWKDPNKKTPAQLQAEYDALGAG